MSEELNKAIGLFQAGDYIRARQVVESYLETSNKNVDAYLLLAAIYAADENYREVIRICETILDLSPGHFRAMYNAAVASQMIFDHQGVVSYASKILDIDSSNINVRIMLVVALCESGKKKESFEQARYVLSLINISLESVLRICRYYRKNNLLDMASNFINEALLVLPENAEIVLEKIYVLLDKNDISSAESILNEDGPLHHSVPTMSLAKSLLYSRAGNVQEAIKTLEAAVMAESVPEILSELGRLYMLSADYEKAMSLYKDNILKNINLAESHHTLGNIYDLYDDYESSIEEYKSALKYTPDSEATYYNLALVYEKKGDFKNAVMCIKQSPKHTSAQSFKQMYVRILPMLGSIGLNLVDESDILDLIEDESIDCQPLSNLVIKKIRQNETINRLVAISISDNLDNFKNAMDEKGINILVDNRMLLNYLLRLTITNYEFECFIRMLRNYMLMIYDEAEGIDNNHINLYAAIGVQCFVTEYVCYQSEPESKIVERLLSISRHQTHKKNLSLIIVLSMYIPVNRIVDDKHAELLSVNDNETIARLLKIQFFDRIIENEIYKTIESPYDIEDETSMLVRNQYEDSPYPVWMNLTRSEPRDIIDVINDVAPYRNNSVFDFKQPDVLIAGSGTGRHVLLSSMRIRSKSITAIDLSKRSLSFAKRKSIDYEISRVKFIHMDILKLPELDVRYDIVESIGVIHHMSDPAVGLDCLVRCLKQGGLINLALYSTIARNHIRKAKSLYDCKSRRITDDEIRSARVSLMASEDKDMVDNLISINDFYALHECRDLIFHECEHNYRISELSDLIREAGLVFVGFDFNDRSVPASYRKMFPGDDMTNLTNWENYEEAHPDTFTGMYNFWCYKQ